jgi:type II secretory pathway pseudopilin PulG
MLEMLIVVGLMSLVAGLSYPSVANGLATLRLRSASDSIATFLTTAVDRAERTQQAVEIVISPAENTLTALSSDAKFTRRLELTDSLRIANVLPAIANADPEKPVARRFVVYPGGAAPRIAIELATPGGAHRTIAVDPLTGFPRVLTP